MEPVAEKSWMDLELEAAQLRILPFNNLMQMIPELPPKIRVNVTSSTTREDLIRQLEQKIDPKWLEASTDFLLEKSKQFRYMSPEILCRNWNAYFYRIV